MRLDELAGLYERPEGFGQSLGQAANELGLNWRADVSELARGRWPEHYRFSHDGHDLWMGPHVALGSGSGANNIARIYLHVADGDDGLPRGSDRRRGRAQEARHHHLSPSRRAPQCSSVCVLSSARTRMPSTKPARARGEALERAAHRVGLLQEQALDGLAIGGGQAHERHAAVALVLGPVDQAGAAELADELARSG